jgi:heptosyltransferase II
VNIVLLVPNWLGDAVMALPAIRDVRRHFSGDRLIVAARPSVSTLFRAVPGIDEIVSLKPGEQPSFPGADIGILFPNSFRSAWLLKRAGVRERWGYRSDFRRLLLTKAVRRPRRKVHFGEYYQQLVRGLGIETGPMTAHVHVPPAIAAAAAKLLQDRGWKPGQPLLGIAPGAAFGHAKRYPPERYAVVAARARDELGVSCVLLGRSEDRDAARQIDAAVDLVGHTDLLMFMGVISHCRAVVANDSGASHLAAAMGIPVAAIFGPTDERYATPLTSSETADGKVEALFEPVFCRPCFLHDCPIDHRCMNRIPADRVFNSVRRLLQQETHA